MVEGTTLKRRAAFAWICGGGVAALGLLVAGYLVFVLTPFGQRLDNLAFAGRETVAAPLAAVDNELLGAVRIPVIAGAAAVVGLLALGYRRFLPGLLAIVAMGGAIEGAEFWKRTLPRPALDAPSVSVPAYFRSDTYPSGHATVGTTAALAVLMACGRRTRRVLAVVGTVFSALFATGVFLMGWHRPSDSLGGLAWCAFCFALVLALASLWKRGGALGERLPLRWLAAAVAVVAACLGVVAVAGALGSAPWAFFGFLGAIVSGAVALFVWAVRAMDVAT